MEINKQNEIFTLTDSTIDFEINGTISHNVDGALNIHFNITNHLGDFIGECHYDKYDSVGMVNFQINCSEAYRQTVTDYMNTVIIQMKNKEII